MLFLTELAMSRGCVIFDFDGVIADTEKVHLAAYNAAFDRHAAEIGGSLEIPEAVYFRRYIAYGDQEGFFHMLRDAGRPTESQLIERLCGAKDAIFEQQLGDFAEPLPGVREILGWLENKRVPRAICSGARKAEIVRLLEGFGLKSHFDVIVAIEDVRRGKPDPEGYMKAFDQLNVAAEGELAKGQSLVIEDSEGGCAAGRAAGLRVLGVATSMELARVQRCADYAVANLGALNHGRLAEWLGI